MSQSSKRESLAGSESRLTPKSDKKMKKKDKTKDEADDVDQGDTIIAIGSEGESFAATAAATKPLKSASSSLLLQNNNYDNANNNNGGDTAVVDDLVQELNEKMTELRDKIKPLKELVEEFGSDKDFNEDLLDYLVVKEQILTSYCTCITFYIYMKSRGLSVKDHPVMTQLLQLRYALEKMRPIDTKIKYQIDRLVQLSTMSVEDRKIATLKPRISALADSDDSDDSDNDDNDDNEMLDDDDDDDDEEDDDSGTGGRKDHDIDDDSSIEDDMDRSSRSDSKQSKSNTSSATGGGGNRKGQTVTFANNKKSRSVSEKIIEHSNSVYKAPKLSAVPYKNDKSIEKSEEKLKRKMKNLKNSAIFESINEEFGITPESVSSSGIAHLSNTKKEIDELINERAKGEEDRFIRTVQSRKDKKQLNRLRAKANDFDNLDEIGDFGDLGALDGVMKLTSRLSSNSDRKTSSKQSRGSSSRGGGDDFDDDDYGSGGGSMSKSATAALSLQKTVSAFASNANGGFKSNYSSNSSGSDSRKRDRASVSSKGGSSIEQFTSFKRKTFSKSNPK